MKLPCSIRPTRPLPTGCRLGLVAYNRQDGTVDVLKVLHFETRVPKDEALSLRAGTPSSTRSMGSQKLSLRID